MSHILRVKGKGVLSAQTIVTIRAIATYHLPDEDEPTRISVQMTATADDIELFLIPYTHDDNIELEIEILDILQPLIDSHDTNLKWLDNIKNLEKGEDHYTLIHNKKDTENDKNGEAHESKRTQETCLPSRDAGMGQAPCTRQTR